MGDSPEEQVKYTSGLRSFTCKQISNASKAYLEAPWKVDGQEVTKFQQVTVVAHVIREDLRDNKKVAYRLDDGTALLSAWRALPKGDGELEHAEDQLLAADERCYVRVVGTISQIRPTDIPSITVEGIQKVTDGYEILHHYMEAMVAASASQQGWPSSEVVKRARAEGDKNYAADVPREEPIPSSSQYTASQYPATQYSATQYAAFYQDTPPTTPRGASLGSPNRTFSPSSARATPQGEASPLQNRASQRSSSNDAPFTPQGTPSRRPQAEFSSSQSQPLNRAASSHTRVHSSAAEAASSTSPFANGAPRTPVRGVAPTQSVSPAPTPNATPARVPGTPTGYRTPPTQTQGSLRIERDPLAHLTGFQRQVMLSIMESQAGRSPQGVHVTVVTKGMRATNRDNISHLDVIAALDDLENRDLIEPTDNECLFYRVVDTGNSYALPQDT